jgi:Asp-tRNA(Asn)/Glu-tRNA(Gln) amidotransferase A subunit family amidase
VRYVWLQQNLVNEFPDGVSERAKAILAKAEAMSPADYRRALARRAAAQACHEQMAPFADAAISMSCPGPAPLHPNDLLDKQLALRPTGDAIFNYPSSMLFAPAVTMPLIGVRGLPVGVQVVGQQGEDARVTAIARWIIENVDAVNVA